MYATEISPDVTFLEEIQLSRIISEGLSETGTANTTSTMLVVLSPAKKRQQTCESQTMTPAGPMPLLAQRDKIDNVVVWEDGSSVTIRFADGFTRTFPATALGVSLANLDIKTARRATGGSALEVQDRRHRESVHIDSSVLRAQVDPVFASHLAETIAKLMARRR